MRARSGMFYTDTGGNGPVILFIHGWGVCTRYFEEVTELLEGFRCIAVDLPGFGQSLPLGKDVPCRPPEMAAVVHDLIVELGIHPVICGHSMGGMVTQEIALGYPDDLVGAILMDTSARPKNERNWMVLVPLSPLMYLFGFRPCMRWFAKRYAVNKKMTPERGIRLLNEIVTNNLKWRLRGCIKGMVGWSSVDRLKDIKAPTLIIHGDLDMMLQLHHSDVLLENIPGSRRIVMKGCGHSPTIERPRKTAEAIREFVEGIGS